VLWLSALLPDGIFDFFLSSRRRHTRCYRDWSSDVCSSDLFVHDDAARILRHGGGEISEIKAGWRNVSRAVFLQPTRSSEVVKLRYVGKSCEIGRRGCTPIMLQPVGDAENVVKLQVTANCQLVCLLLSALR